MGHAKGGIDYIRRSYNVPAKIGGRVKLDGQPGRICSTEAARLAIHLDGMPARHRVYAHPTWRMEYL